MSSSNEIVAELYLSFRDRCKEVQSYIQFVSVMTALKYDYLASLDSVGAVKLPYYKIDRELEKTLRANGLLLLYNLVEATMANAVDAIHKAVDDNLLSFDDLSRQLKNITISHFKRAVRDSHDSVLDVSEHPIQVAMVSLGYDKEKLFSGNVDCKEIIKTAQRYGFSSPNPNLKGRGIAQHLRLVKNKRNALAHGRLSFEQCGQETPPDILPEITHQTIVYLRAVVMSVSNYIRHEHYKYKGEGVA